MADLVAIYEVVKETIGAIEKLAALKKELSARPDAAALALASALAEVERTYQALDSEIARFVAFSGPGALDAHTDLAALYALDGGSIRVRIEAGRGHCTRISNIYDRHLRSWFDSVFAGRLAEQAILREVFDTLSMHDKQTFVLMDHGARFLEERAASMLDAMMAHPPDLAAAHALARASFLELRPMRRALADLVHQLRTLENELIEIASLA
jgi:hypothetical protein